MAKQQTAKPEKTKFSDSPLRLPVIIALIVLAVAAGVYLGTHDLNNLDAGGLQEKTANPSPNNAPSGSCLKEFLDCGKQLPGGGITEGLTLADESCDCPKNTYLSQYSKPGNKYCSCWQGG